MLALKSPVLLSLAQTTFAKSIVRTYYKKPFFYEDRYSGDFDYHDRYKYPKRMGSLQEEELLDEVHAIRDQKIDEPSPFHIIRRIRPMYRLHWSQKVTLRRLNLHSASNGDVVIVPNTPQFNSMIAQVKHLIQLKPAKFVDGRIPTEEDIGALKVCPFTGAVKIDEKLRPQQRRLNTEKPLLWQGNHLRAQINRMYGLGNNAPRTM